MARLRVLAARYPRDARIMEHVDTIRRQSPECRWLRHEHHVAAATHRDYVLDHPVVGELRLSAELVGLPGDPELQGMDLFAAEPGSESEDRLRHLAATTTRVASSPRGRSGNPANLGEKGQK